MSDSDKAKGSSNRLAGETSPYLLQHAHNPVDWYPWGNEALERARSEQRPIFLSIGYSACHWCHVMERESFEDPAIGKLMSDAFICIKVDREERPDLDDIYMQATVALNHGQGGWPMTVFLTPDQQPFFAGTYFPPSDRHGRPGFRTVLERLAHMWKTDPAHVREEAAGLTEHLRKHSGIDPDLTVGEEQIDHAVARLQERFDPVHGGFGSAPKFPPATTLSFLLRYHSRTGHEKALEMVTKTLDGMAKGGMYDQVGGGFSRYSTDDEWLVPHFEKMLYDNALLVRVYLETFQITRDPLYARVAREVLDYVDNEMTSAEGGYHSATDADSEGVEGKFFVWTPAEIAAILDDEDAVAFCAYYDITDAGNWEGQSIPRIRRAVEEVASDLGMETVALERILLESRRKVYEVRARRVMPALDDKVLTSWNALMISAMAEGGRVLGDARYLESARAAARFIRGNLMTDDGSRLLRTYRAGKAHLNAYLEDYAYLAEALVDLYEATGESEWIQYGQKLADVLIRDFGDDDAGAFFSTAKDHEELIIRHREGTDGATPNPNATAACSLIRISRHLGRADLLRAAVGAIQSYGKTIDRYPTAFAKSLIAVDMLLEDSVEIALVGDPADGIFEACQEILGQTYLPNRTIAMGTGVDEGGGALPLLEGKVRHEGLTTWYICHDFRCEAPGTDPEELKESLARSTRESVRRLSVGTRHASRATAEKSREWKHRFQGALTPEAFVDVPRASLVVSRLGFGGYRVDHEVSHHRSSLRRALLMGVNLIDTSTNYTDGGSEKLVGAVLHEMVAAGEIERESVVVVSKIGYVQGQNMRIAKERDDAGDGFPEMVAYSEGCWHCIHPDWIEDQLERSLDRLGLETLDICLLHNPEYFLSDAKQKGINLEAARETFYARLERSFRFLESQVEAGRIQCYGVSSNTACSPDDDPECTRLTRMLQAARSAGGDGHHFAVLQVPLNLFEAEAHTLVGESGRSVLEEARANNVLILINRPLNAFVDNSIVRLADFEVPTQEVDAQAQLAALHRLEDEFRESIASSIKVAEGTLEGRDFFRFSEKLDGLIDQVESQEHWKQIEMQMVLPQVDYVIRMLDSNLQGSILTAWRDWRGRFLKELDRSLAEYARQATLKSQLLSEQVSRLLDPILPAERRSERLSRKALWVVASTPGVGSVLVGMRRESYVDDAMGVLTWPGLEEVTPIYQSMAIFETMAIFEKRTPLPSESEEVSGAVGHTG